MQRFEADYAETPADVLNAISIAWDLANGGAGPIWFEKSGAGFVVQSGDSPHQLFKKNFPLLAAKHPETR